MFINILFASVRTIIPVIDVENISSNKLKEIYVRDKSTTLPDDDINFKWDTLYSPA